ncbi:MAG: dTDP-4-dehydrorhamnose reductase [Planctomycetaceae bacterium]|nr:dTDP-4-dehydrorhamnose reductase [Planctomycetaceae bacterium]
MKIMITGAAGQLARSLLKRGRSRDVLPFTSAELDIRDPIAVKRAITAVQPQIVINAAAYTAVDRAEEDESSAIAVNALGAQNIAEGVRAVGARMVQISTDFVFGGGHSSPIRPGEIPKPESAYGRSKFAGETAVSKILEPQSLLTLRTAWLYSSGPGNFVSTMIRLMQERSEVRVVADQVGTPTWSVTLADTVFELIDGGACGTHHVTDAGVASWYDFAVAIRDLSAERGMLDGEVRVVPISTADYPTPAKRPSYSVLDKTSLLATLGHGIPYWRDALGACLDERS